MDHNKLGLDDSLIEATRAIVEKNLHQNQEKLDKQLDEATVDTNKYSWGTMKVVHHGSSFSIPLHPEHHQAIAKLKDRDEHFFKDETGSRWKAERDGDVVHFTGNSYSNKGYKTKVPFKSLKEEVELNEMKHMGSYTQSHVMKKIKSGDWEASSDVKPNRHVELRHHSGKRITVKVEHDPVKEDVELVEGKKWSKLGYSSEHDYHKARYTHASGKKAPAGTSTMAMMVMADKAERESGKKLHEDVEQIDELSKATLGNYVNKAVHSNGKNRVLANLAWDKSKEDGDALDNLGNHYIKIAKKRSSGIDTAIKKLTKEQLEEIEALAAKHGLTKE